MEHPQWFIFSGMKLLARITNNGIEVPRWDTPESVPFPLIHSYRFERVDAVTGRRNEIYYGGLVEDDSLPGGTGTVKSTFEFLQMRNLVGRLDASTYMDTARAKQLTEWDATMRLCPRCTTSLEQMEDESAKGCPACGLHFYPPVSPAVIVAVFKGDAILLAHNERFPEGLYSLIAGFVEPGENLEQCVQREIAEEVGITVKNVRYFGSQPWPFPHSLMIGFSADYVGGAIRPDGVEIMDAGWFTPEAMPDLPLHGSISRQIIDRYLELGPY